MSLALSGLFHPRQKVSMKSGLEGRNNPVPVLPVWEHELSLNEVRPGRPEQFTATSGTGLQVWQVSLKSGLEGRNNGGAGGDGDRVFTVSMKSGLEGRNNRAFRHNEA